MAPGYYLGFSDHPEGRMEPAVKQLKKQLRNFLKKF